MSLYPLLVQCSNATPNRADRAHACACFRQGLNREEQHRSEKDFVDFIRKFQEGEVFPYREQLRKNTGMQRLCFPNLLNAFTYETTPTKHNTIGTLDEHVCGKLLCITEGPSSIVGAHARPELANIHTMQLCTNTGSK
jgi:hypothetical protein